MYRYSPVVEKTFSSKYASANEPQIPRKVGLINDSYLVRGEIPLSALGRKRGLRLLLPDKKIGIITAAAMKFRQLPADLRRDLKIIPLQECRTFPSRLALFDRAKYLKTRGDIALKPFFRPGRMQRGNSESHPVQIGSSKLKSVNPHCGSPTVISCSEPSLIDKENLVLGKQVLEDQCYTPVSESYICLEVGSQPRPLKRTDDDWRPLSTDSPCGSQSVKARKPVDDNGSSLKNELLLCQKECQEGKGGIDQGKDQFSCIPRDPGKFDPNYVPQPFTHSQELQLRAQIIAYGSLICGSTPEEQFMSLAFGDGGRSMWEDVWHVALEQEARSFLDDDAFATPARAKTPSKTTTPVRAGGVGGIGSRPTMLSPMVWQLEIKPEERPQQQLDCVVLQQKVKELENRLKEAQAESESVILLQQQVKDLQNELRVMSMETEILRQKNQEHEERDHQLKSVATTKFCQMCRREREEEV